MWHQSSRKIAHQKIWMAQKCIFLGLVQHCTWSYIHIRSQRLKRNMQISVAIILGQFSLLILEADTEILQCGNWAILLPLHSDFSLNQLWLISEGLKLPFEYFWRLLILILGNFTLENVKKFHNNSKFIASKLVKILLLRASIWSKLNSRKIWLAEKSWNSTMFIPN